MHTGHAQKPTHPYKRPRGPTLPRFDKTTLPRATQNKTPHKRGPKLKDNPNPISAYTTQRTHLLQSLVQRLRRLWRREIAQQQLLGRHLGPVEVAVGVLAGHHGGRLQGHPDEHALRVGVRKGSGYAAVAGSDVGRRRAADRPDGEAQLSSEGYLESGGGARGGGGYAGRGGEGGAFLVRA